MTAAGTAKPSTSSRGSVAHGARAARGSEPREGSQFRGLGAYALPSLGRAFALRALVGLTGERHENRTGWTHVAYEGEWAGHPDGAFTLDDGAFKSCIAAFESQKNPTPVDFEHASVRDLPKAPAAGWVQRLELREDGLWALVEWTEDAAKDIRSGAYRYCSGVFVFDKADRVTGEPVSCALHSIGLTNTPFIDGQKPIVLSQRRVALSSGGQMKIDRGAFEEALKQLDGKEFTEEQLKALIDSVAAMAKAQDPKASEEPEGAELDIAVEEPEMPAEEAALKSDEKLDKKDDKADAKKLADEVPPAPEGEPADPASIVAELESIAAAMGKDVAGLIAYLREMAAGAGGDAAAANPAALKAEIAALKSTMQSYGKQLEGYRKRDEAELKAKRDADLRALSDEVDAMVSTGVIVKADAEHWRGLALADATRFRALKSTLKPAVPTGREASAMSAQPSESQSMDASSLDKNDPTVRALFDRYRTHWRITDPAKLEKAVRDHLKIASAG